MRRAATFVVAGLLVVAAATLAVPSRDAAAAPAPRQVIVEVVPNYPGVQFTIDGMNEVTGPGGKAQVADPNLSTAAGSVSVPEQVLPGNIRVQLDRVTSDPNHSVFTRNLVVELDAQRLVTVRLLAPDGKAVPLSQVDSVTFADSLGGTTRLPRTQLRAPVWLPSSRPSPVAQGVANRNITYAVKSAIINGTNAVNSGQLHFDTRNTLTWNIPVILHSLTVVGNNLMAGHPAGSSVQLTYPDGSVRVVRFGRGHQVTIYGLPRGSYGVKIGGGLLSLASTVQLSKDQTATEIVVTIGDALEITAILFVVAAVIVAAGVIGRRRRQATQAGGPVGADSGGPGPAGPEDPNDREPGAAEAADPVSEPAEGVGGAARV